jgi:class 3 adenylate cyclase
MSRVTYTDMQATGAQDALRAANKVRLVNDAEEGTGVNALPVGVFGFTYSPGLASAPLFAVRRYRSYEIHKLAGETIVIAFATPEDAARLASSSEEIAIRVQPQPEDGREMLVQISYSRIKHHRQYAAPNQHGFTVTVLPQ